MSLYSYKSQEPDDLPIRLRLDDGSTRTSLNELSDSELTELGFVSVTKPSFNADAEYLVWNGSEYVVTPYKSEELNQKQRIENAKKHVDYVGFWRKLISTGSNGGATDFYKKIRTSAITSTEVSVIFTEFMILISEAKLGLVNQSRIQEYINTLFLKLNFTDAEKSEFQSILNKTNLHLVYFVPDSEFLSTHTYDSTLNQVIPPDDGNS